MRRGLCQAIGWPPGSWATLGGRKSSGGEAYRCLLYEDGVERAGSEAMGKPPARRGISVDEAREVIAAGGRLSHYELVRCRVRWLSEGVALGSRSFLRKALEHEQALGQGDSGATVVRPFPAGGDGDGNGGGAWFTLSRLRQRGIG